MQRIHPMGSGLLSPPITMAIGKSLRQQQTALLQLTSAITGQWITTRISPLMGSGLLFPLKDTVDPLALSFCATIQHLCCFTCLLAHATDEQREYEYTQLIYLVSTEKLPFRPNRVEPRAVKRRPKAYPRLTKPRRQLKRKLMNDRYFPRAVA